MKSKPNNKRLSILSLEEIDIYFGPPQFLDAERSHYFSMSESELKLSKIVSSQTQWYFILQMGYFKAKKQFFVVSHTKVKADIDFITSTYRCKKPRKNVSEDTHRKVRQMILMHLNFSDDLNAIKTKLINRAKDIVCSTSDPKALFKSLYDCAIESKWIIPQYSTFQNTISNALKQETSRLQNSLEKLLPQYAINAMNKLLSVDKQYYEMTSIQKDQKNFRYNEVQKIIEHKANYNRLYHVSKNVIPKLKITRNMLVYYASLTSHYPISKLKKLPIYTTYLYLLCYISSRIEKFNDNLMNSFVYYVDKYKKSEKEFGKNCIYESKLQFSREVKTKVPKVMKLIIGKPSPDKTIQEKALTIAPKEKLIQLMNYITNDKLDEYYFRWQHYDEKQGEITKNLRPIFMSLNFKCSDSCHNLAKAIAFLKEQFEKGKSLSQIKKNYFPVAFIPKNKVDYIYSLDKHHHITEIHFAQFEYCVYAQIRKEFKDNNVTIYDSVNHNRTTGERR